MIQTERFQILKHISHLPTHFDAGKESGSNAGFQGGAVQARRSYPETCVWRVSVPIVIEVSTRPALHHTILERSQSGINSRFGVEIRPHEGHSSGAGPRL